MLVYKIFRKEEWEAFQEAGKTAGSVDDIADGFMHFSTAEQAPGTAAKHFSGVAELTLAAVEADGLAPDLRWETSRGGDLFPHLYRPLNLAEVVWSHPLPFAAGSHRFPENME